MVEQLMNQNPLDPTDTDSYLDKLVSYASYDTQVSISEDLQNVVDNITTTLAANGIGYVGMTVEAKGSTNTLEDGAASWNYTLNSNAESVKIKVLNESGVVVYSETGSTSAGAHSFTWDGVTSSGEQMADGGTYTIQIDATDSDGDDVDGFTTVIGVVTGVDYSGGEAVLNIGDAEVAIDNILSVHTS